MLHERLIITRDATAKEEAMYLNTAVFTELIQILGICMFIIKLLNTSIFAESELQ